jgi:hypothetical protein
MTKRKNISESSNATTPSLIPYDWQIIHSCHSDTFQRCICGHNVKRLTYIYNKRTCEIMRVGTTCVKKYGITQHITNSLLYVVLHKYIVDEIDAMSESHEDSYVFIEIESCLRTCIQEKYKEINDKIDTAHASSSVNYYDVVVPFRRLLTETCDLVMEYKFLSLKELLQEIEDNINLLDNNIKHRMIDEYENSSAASESASTTASSVDTLDTISEIDEATDIDDSIRPEIQAVLEDILQNVLVEPIADAVVEDNMTPTTPTTLPFNENIHLTIQNETASNTTSDSSLTPLSWCDGTTTCYCTVHYRLKNLEYNIQEFKKEVQLHVENVKKTEELYRTMLETYRPLLKSSSTESSSS